MILMQNNREVLLVSNDQYLETGNFLFEMDQQKLLDVCFQTVMTIIEKT